MDYVQLVMLCTVCLGISVWSIAHIFSDCRECVVTGYCSRHWQFPSVFCTEIYTYLIANLIVIKQ